MMMIFFWANDLKTVKAFLAENTVKMTGEIQDIGSVSFLTFEDPDAGKPTRRFYVVAVDALGQEGFPSAPVWCNREWKACYR